MVERKGQQQHSCPSPRYILQSSDIFRCLGQSEKKSEWKFELVMDRQYLSKKLACFIIGNHFAYLSNYPFLSLIKVGLQEWVTTQTVENGKYKVLNKSKRKSLNKVYEYFFPSKNSLNLWTVTKLTFSVGSFPTILLWLEMEVGRSFKLGERGHRPPLPLSSLGNHVDVQEIDFNVRLETKVVNA